MRDDSRVTLTFRDMDPTQPPASDLLDAMVVELSALYGDVTGSHMPSATPADFALPRGTLLVGFEGDAPVCVGGIKPLEPAIAEIKRMYVVPDARRRGIARALLGALEDAARERGYERVRLDTGPLQAHAAALYTASGYAEIGNYNANPVANYWGEKAL